MGEKMPSSLKKTFRGPETFHAGNTGKSLLNQPDNPFFGAQWGDLNIRRFRLIFRDGMTVSIPYAHLPIFILVPDKHLTIRTSEMEITITGHGLQVLESLLSEERVEWIKESNTGIAASEGEVFVEKIEVEGKLLL